MALNETVIPSPDPILEYGFVLFKYMGVVEARLKAPLYHILLEVALVLWIVRLWFYKSYVPKESRLNLTVELLLQEENALIADWKPEPLVDCSKVASFTTKRKFLQGKVAHYVTDGSRTCLNLASFNFLDFIGNHDIEEAAIKTMKKYGVGTCGPRGFYGTLDVHLNLEKKIAAFMNVEDAILYSYGFSTIASVIPAYSKNTDIIFCDKGVSVAAQKGVLASRSKVYWFNHNDMADLEAKFKEQQAKDAKNPKKAKATRRFLIVEGLYVNYGDIAPLPQLLEMKYKYKARLIVDESISFGVLGKTGRGITEHLNVPVHEVDMISVSMENALGTVGGFCCGSSFVIDHQRLSGQGYCFSASLPALLTTAGLEALDRMQSQPDMFQRLQTASQRLRTELSERLQSFEVKGDPSSPVIHLVLKDHSLDRAEQTRILEAVSAQAWSNSIAITVARHIEHEDLFLPPPSIRITANCALLEEEISSAVSVISSACASVL